MQLKWKFPLSPFWNINLNNKVLNINAVVLFWNYAPHERISISDSGEGEGGGGWIVLLWKLEYTN